MLEAPITIPGALDHSTTAPTWQLVFQQVLEPMESPVLVGDDSAPPCGILLYRHARGFRLLHNCTGEFDVLASGAVIHLVRAADASDEAIANDVIGRVLAIAMHAAGDLCLHASAVAIDDRVIAFMASKGTGKSTLATALLGAGAAFVTDDALRIRFTDAGPVAEPGVHALRLRDDSLAAVNDSGLASRRAFDGKNAIDHVPKARCAAGPLPIDALYLVRPVPAEAAEDVTRVRQDDFAAVMSLVAHGKLGTLLGGDEGGKQFSRIAAVAAQVPVYVVNVVRDLDRVGSVASQIVEWHGDAMVPLAQDS